MNAEFIASRLEKARPQGDGWQACCPAHGDKNPSLSINDKPGGGVLVKCFAGCDQSAVIDALKARGAWPQADVPAFMRQAARQSRSRRVEIPPEYESYAAMCDAGGIDADDVTRASVRRERELPRWVGKEPTAEYIYRDAAGNELGKVKRFEYDDESKDTIPFFRNGRAGAPAGLRPLYGLDQLAARREDRVCVCEGEKAVGAATLLLPDYICITSMGGSGSAGKSDWSPLAGRDVVIWTDADEPGDKYAAAVTNAVTVSGGRCRTIDLERLWGGTHNDGRDAADWPDDLPLPHPLPITLSPELKAIRKLRPVALDMNRALREEPPELDYVIPGMLVGTVGALIGTGGVSKSMLAMQLGAGVAGARDTTRLLDDEYNYPADVIYIALEDREDVLLNRFNAIGKHLDERSHDAMVKHLSVLPAVGWPLELVSGGRDVETNDAWLQELTDLATGKRLMILDTLRRSHDADEIDSRAMSRLMKVLEVIALQTGCSIIYVHHAGKAATMNGAGGEAQSARGSTVLIDHARYCLTMRGPTHEDMRQVGVDRDKDPILYEAVQRQCAIVGSGKVSYGAKTGDVWLIRSNDGVLVTTTAATVTHDLDLGDADRGDPGRSQPKSVVKKEVPDWVKPVWGNAS